jgi:DNA-binding SARP family transcriptional activator
VLRVSLLGEQSITSDRADGLARPSSRAVSLLAFLACAAGSPQSRQRIAGVFWPASTGAQALTNLRRELHHLRRVLGDEPSLVVTPRELTWRDSPTCRVDVRVFSRERAAALRSLAAGQHDAAALHATRAISEYRGDFLPGTYDDWTLDARQQLERHCVELCDMLCAARAKGGDLPGALQIARRRIRLAPLEESGHRAMMRLQADMGDLTGALSTYHHCASVLERELGVLPGPATRAMFDMLMARAVPARQPIAGVRPASRSGQAAAFVGRIREALMLHRTWQAALAGRPAMVLVRGGPGVGKTRLVAEVAEAARRQGAAVAATQCFASAGRLPLTPVADWLRHEAVASALATLDPAWRAEVSRLIPADGHGEGGAGARAIVDAWQRSRFFEGLTRALTAAGRPLLLVLDNVHWCDQETLAFLSFCLRRAGAAPLLVAGTLRDDSIDNDRELAEWAARMRATGMLSEFLLSPLGLADTGRLARAVSGQPLTADDSELLHATTGGFPLYIIEAVRSRVDRPGTPLPAGDLAAVLRKRLAHSSPAAREVAGLAAAVGTNFRLDLLCAASDLDEAAIVAAVDELWRRRILREFRDGYDFSHDLLREAAYAQVSRPKRWLLHRRVAKGLELAHAGNSDLIAAQLAEQYARGGQPERAIAHYQRAADVAAGVFAHGEAIRLHRKALSVIALLPAGGDRDEYELAVLEGLAAPLNARDGYSSAELQQALERAIDLAWSVGRRESALRGMVALWASRFVQGRTADSYAVARQVLAMAEEGDELSAPAHFAVGGAAVSLGRLGEGLHHLQLASTLGRGAVSLSIGTRPDAHATAWAAHAHWLLGDTAAARSGCAEAVALARSIGHPYNLAVALAYCAITQQLCGDLPALREAASELRRLCDRYEFAYYREWGRILDGWARADASGIGLIRQGVGNLVSEGSLARMPYWLSLLADLLGRCRKAGKARAVLDKAIADARAREDLWWLPEVLRMRAAHDDDRRACARLAGAARIAADQGSLALLARCRQDLAGLGGAAG